MAIHPVGIFKRTIFGLFDQMIMHYQQIICVIFERIFCVNRCADAELKENINSEIKYKSIEMEYQ